MIRKFRYSSSNKELAKNPQHQFAQRRALRFYRANAIYSFVPKNACSTMRLSLAFENGCIDDISDFEWIHSNNETFKADLEALAIAKYTFVLLRCPYSRLASVYLDKIVGREFEAGVLYRKTRGIKRIKGAGLSAKLHHRIYEKRCKSFIDSLTFHDFIELLKTPYIRGINSHWQPQVDFLVYQDYDSWFCVEEFSKAVTALKRDIDLEVKDARDLTLHGISNLRKVSDKDFSNTTSIDIRRIKENGECPAPMSLYNDNLIETVNSLYHEDINLYKTVFGDTNLMFK